MDSCSEMNTSCDTSQKMKKVTCIVMDDFVFPALQISREKTKGILGRGHHLVNKKYMTEINYWSICRLMMLE
jgi:hypothetical protein